MDPMIFQFIGDSITAAMNAYVNSTVPAVISMITATAIAFTTLYYMWVGYLMIFGRLEGSFGHLCLSAGKFAIIAAFALSAGHYMDWVVGSAHDMETGFTQAFAGDNGARPDTVYQMIDKSVGKGWELSADLWESASNRGITEIGMMIGEYFNAIVIALATIIIAIPAGAMIVVAKTVLELLLGIGPLFVMCLMWAPTKGFFDRWFGGVITAIFQIALTAAVLAFALKMFGIVVDSTDVNSSSDSPFFASLRIGGFTVVMLILLYKVFDLGAQLGGGISSAAITLGGMAARAAGVGRSVASAVNPMSTRRDLESGMMVTAGRLNHLTAGNTMWNPAYRQHVLQNVGKNWGRASGGTVTQ